MSNKKQLQDNNTNLATALDNINGLPMAEDVKYGKYIWKQTSYTGTIWKNPTIRFYFENNYRDMRITSNDVDLSMINGGFFVGMIIIMREGINDYTLEVKSYDEVSDMITIGGTFFGTARTAVYENGIIKASSTLSNSSCSYNSSYTFDEKKYSMDYNETDNRYAASDTPDKYPDDGEQDGYWYIKMTSTIESLFDKKFSYGEVTKTSTSGSLQVYHGLGIKPKLVVIYPKLNPSNLIFGMGADEPYKIVSGTKYYDPYYGGISFAHSDVPERDLQRTAEYFEHTKYDVTGTFYWFAIA